ncbi:MAG: hypothetical protein HYY14_04740 [Candidatus Omnitrophica bacterium]|nr:hypothetical protein [Candidatus Omnitrophota bacterium]
MFLFRALLCGMMLLSFLSARPAEAEDSAGTSKAWHSNIWTREEAKRIVQKGDEVTVTPEEGSLYPTLVLKVPTEKSMAARFYFWQGVKFYVGGEPLKAIDELTRASLAEPHQEDIQAALLSVKDAYELVTSGQPRSESETSEKTED